MPDKERPPTLTPDPDPAPAPKADPAPDPAPEFKAITSQEDFDKRIQERIARVKTTPPADYEDLKAKAAEFDKLQESQKTELEKANERAAKLEREKTAAEELAQRRTVESSIVAEAAKRGVDPDIAVAMIDRASIDFDDDGTPSNLASVMDALLQAKPSLAGGARGTSADQGARNGGPEQVSQEALQSMSPAEIVKAQKEGRLDSLLGRS